MKPVELLRRKHDRLSALAGIELDSPTGSLARAQKLTAEAAAAMSVLVDRNIAAKDAEKAGDEYRAVDLLEANVADEFDGSYPYERLIRIYLAWGRADEATRIVGAYRKNASHGDARMDALCKRVPECPPGAAPGEPPSPIPEGKT